jgi:hypothetical protein
MADLEQASAQELEKFQCMEALFETVRRREMRMSQEERRRRKQKQSEKAKESETLTAAYGRLSGSRDEMPASLEYVLSAEADRSSLRQCIESLVGQRKNDDGFCSSHVLQAPFACKLMRHLCEVPDEDSMRLINGIFTRISEFERRRPSELAQSERFSIRHLVMASTDAMKRTKKAIADVRKSTVDVVADVGSTAVNVVADAGSTAVNVVADAGSTAVNAVGEVGSTAVNVVADVGSTAVNAVTDAGGTAMGAGDQDTIDAYQATKSQSNLKPITLEMSRGTSFSTSLKNLIKPGSPRRSR